MEHKQISDEQRRDYLDKLEARERHYTRLQRQRMSCDDFELLTIIGRGAFGEVCLASFPSTFIRTNQDWQRWRCNHLAKHGCRLIVLPQARLIGVHFVVVHC